MKTHLTDEEAEAEVLNQIKAVIRNDQWMVMGVYCTPDGTVCLQETTCKFPNALHGQVLSLVRNALAQKLENSIVSEPEPLPVACLANGSVSVPQVESNNEMDS